MRGWGGHRGSSCDAAVAAPFWGRLVLRGHQQSRPAAPEGEPGPCSCPQPGRVLRAGRSGAFHGLVPSQHLTPLWTECPPRATG